MLAWTSFLLLNISKFYIGRIQRTPLKALYDSPLAVNVQLANDFIVAPQEEVELPRSSLCFVIAITTINNDLALTLRNSLRERKERPEMR